MHASGTAAALPHVTAWAERALALLADRPGVRRVGLALAEGGGRRLLFTASDRLGGRIEWCHVDAYDDVPLTTVVRTGRPAVGTLVELGERYPEFVERQRDTGTLALATVPIVAAGQTLGAFVLYLDRPRPLDATQRRELTRTGQALGAELRRAQRAGERREPTLADEPVPADALVALHRVPPRAACVAEARRFARSTLEEWGVAEDATDVAVLCLSELVTNAVIHTHAGCTVRLLLDGDVLTGTIRDAGGPPAGDVEPAADPLRVHGRGLQVVGALASRWGSELDVVGTTVWFTVLV